MDGLKKIGITALAGTLASLSAAQAGSLAVSGTAELSYVQRDNDELTGNPIGMGSNLTFKGSGELDNGWTFDLTVAMLNSDAYSNTVVAIDMGGLGKLNINQGDSGNGIDAFDDKMPTAWEEPWGNALGTGVKLVSGSGPNSNIMYSTPTLAGTTVTFTMAPDMGSGNVADKSYSGQGTGTTGAGHDVTININPSLGTEILSGLNLFVGAHQTQNTVATENNLYEGVAGLTLDLGPISLGVAAWIVGASD